MKTFKQFLLEMPKFDPSPWGNGAKDQDARIFYGKKEAEKEGTIRGYFASDDPEAPKERTFKQRFGKKPLKDLTVADALGIHHKDDIERFHKEGHLRDVIEASISNRKFYRIAAALAHPSSRPAHVSLALRLLEPHVSNQYKGGGETEHTLDDVYNLAHAMKYPKLHDYIKKSDVSGLSFEGIKEQTHPLWFQGSGAYEAHEIAYDPFHPRSLMHPELGNIEKEDEPEKDE